MRLDRRFSSVAPLAMCFGIVLSVSGCAVMIDSAISKYNEKAPQISLGASKEEVLAILGPTQDGLPANARKQPEQYMKDGVKIDILYFRSGRQPDDLTTDDEFTPYVFQNGRLTGIGWSCLGGPKSSGQVVPRVNIQQNTVVH
jgi:hypothetical protein